MSPVAAVGAAALFAGLVAIAVTAAIERWGGVVGGFLGTLPTTIVPAAIGLHAALPSTEAFRESMFVTPAGMLLNAGFLFLWRALPPRLPRWSLSARLTLMTGLALVAWLLGAVVLVLASGWLRDSGRSLLGPALGVVALLASTGVLACLRSPPAPKARRRVGTGTLAARGLLAAASVATAVIIATRGGELAAGVVSVFPAIFLTTMVSLWLSQGEAVPSGAVGPMMLGSTSVAAFGLVAAWSFPALGVALGTLVAWFVAAVGVTLPASLWLTHRRRGQAATAE